MCAWAMGEMSGTSSTEATAHDAEDALRLSEERLRVLLETSQALAAPFELQPILQLIVDNATKLLALSTGALYLVEGDTIVLAATTPPMPPDFPEALRVGALSEHPHIESALRTGAPIVLEDAPRAALTAAERQAVEARGLRSILYLPLIAGTRRTGTLILGSTDRPRVLSPEDVAVAKGFSGQAAQTIENVQLYDRTQRFAAEMEREVDERRQTEAALRASEEKFRALFEQAGDYALVLEPQADGTPMIVDANEAACRAHRYSRDELLGKSIFELDARDLSREDVESIRQLIMSGRTLRFETIHRRKDGTVFPVEVIAKQVRAGNKTLVFTTERDVTERKRAAAERDAFQARLTEADKMDSIGRLAGGVAHDFNNMIQAVLGNVDLVKLELPPDSPFHQRLDDIRNAADRSARLTRQLLAFARRQSFEPKLVDLNEAVEGVLRMLRPLIGEKITLVWRPASGLPAVRLDPSQLDQVVTNLCVNARDAVAPDHGRITIETRTAHIDEGARITHPELALGSYVMLIVADDGCGMDETTRAHAFEPFFTTKEKGKGTGLGLATVYGIVQQNHGTIRLESAPTAGTTFTIYFPVQS